MAGTDTLTTVLNTLAWPIGLVALAAALLAWLG